MNDFSKAAIYRLRNNTDGTITSVSCTHNDTDAIGVKSLKEGKYSDERHFHVTDPFGTDTWKFTFTDKNGKVRRGTHDCNYDSSDQGHVCTIHFNQTNYDILTPITPGCTGVSYDD